MMETRDPAAALDTLFGGTQPPGDANDEDRSKDAFFVRLGELAEAMIARHGKDFTMGALGSCGEVHRRGQAAHQTKRRRGYEFVLKLERAPRRRIMLKVPLPDSKYIFDRRIFKEQGSGGPDICGVDR